MIKTQPYQFSSIQHTNTQSKMIEQLGLGRLAEKQGYQSAQITVRENTFHATRATSQHRGNCSISNSTADRTPQTTLLITCKKIKHKNYF